jgi:pimeloyl-ACP methyl ester carboxylesterase
MTRSRRRALAALIFAALLVGAAPAGAATLDWQDCGEGFQCATAEVPRDYDRPDGRTLDLAVARLPATDQSRRIGSLFVNPGGPGAGAAEFIRGNKELFASLNDRFDIVGFDPRGTGESEGAIDCKVNQETDGVYSQPFTTPENLDVGAFVGKVKGYVQRCVELSREILPYASTANGARDMDFLREAVGDKKLTYLGFSYGTFLGATYASLFPRRYRALVLDGPLDADQYINRPLENLSEQTAGFERAINRLFQACAAQQDVCRFGGTDPLDAFDQLVEHANQSPLPAQGPDPRPVDGDDFLAAAVLATYNKGFWGLLAEALELAAAGDGTGIRVLANAFYGRNDDGTYDPGTDRYFTLSALDQRYPTDVRTYLTAGNHSWGQYDHFWFNNGYAELNWGLFPIRPRDAYYGPFEASDSAPTVLVVNTTYDPATPFRGGKRLVRQLGNARMLTMRGDGHTAYGGNSPSCIDPAVDAYLEAGTLPPDGTSCPQEVPFARPQLQAESAPAAARRLLRQMAPHVKPVTP